MFRKYKLSCAVLVLMVILSSIHFSQGRSEGQTCWSYFFGLFNGDEDYRCRKNCKADEETYINRQGSECNSGLHCCLAPITPGYQSEGESCYETRWYLLTRSGQVCRKTCKDNETIHVQRDTKCKAGLSCCISPEFDQFVAYPSVRR